MVVGCDELMNLLGMFFCLCPETAGIGFCTLTVTSDRKWMDGIFNERLQSGKVADAGCQLVYGNTQSSSETSLN